MTGKFLFALKLGYMFPATRNNSTEAANKAGKFDKEPKGFGKNEEMEGWSDFFNHTVGAIGWHLEYDE